MADLRMICVVVALLFTSYLTTADIEKPTIPEAEPEDEPETGETLSDLLNDFAFRLQKEVSDDENVVFSPFSIYSGLAMLYLGSSTETKQQLASALKWNSENQDEKNFLEALKDLTDKLNPENGLDGVTLKTAAKGWLGQNFKILKKFNNNMKNQFGFKFSRKNFAQSESSRKDINMWVANHTGNRINQLFPFGSFDAMTKVVLANAIYFKGLWSTPFKKKYTSLKNFYTQGSSKPKKVSTMFQSDDFLIGRHRNVQLLELPYGAEGEFSMLFARPLHQSELYRYEFAPDEFTSLATLSKDMSSTLLREFQGSMRKTKADVHIPRFTVERSINLAEKLQELGITKVFQQGTADLSPINGKRNLYVSSALHKAFIQVDEEGSEASGATGIGISLLSLPPQIHMNRPFLFYIIHKPQNAVVFAGRVMDPSA